MSYREKCAAILDSFPDAQLVNVATMLQSMKQAIDDAQNPEIPNAETVAALLEGDEILRTGKGQAWTGSTEELFKQILGDDQ